MAKSDILKFHACIQDKKMLYYDADWQDRWSNFKDVNDGKNIEVTFEMVDTPEHFQHKFYRGFLLPDIAFASGEKDIYRQHIILKRDYLFTEVPSGLLDDIPKRHFKNGIFIMNQRVLHSLDNVPCRYIKGVICIVNDKGHLIGYIPSTSTLKYAEFDKFIDDGENRLFIDLQGRLGEEGRDQATAGYVRELAKASKSSIGEILKRGMK